MQLLLLAQLFLSVSPVFLKSLPPENLELEHYQNQRVALLNQTQKDSIGGHLSLDGTELEVNSILMHWKNLELEEGFKDPKSFWAAQHFFTSKPYIEQSKVFKIIRQLPKGGVLHAHFSALVSTDYILTNITYRDNLFAMQSDGRIALKFSQEAPGNLWTPVKLLRESDKSFDFRLRQQFTLLKNGVNRDINSVWRAFQTIFDSLKPLLTYRPVFKDYFYQALTELYEDNIRYLEFRSTLPKLYDLDGTIYDKEETMKVWQETIMEFTKIHPDFWGVKFILAPKRFVNITVVEEFRHLMLQLTSKYPDFIAGFDLVGQEDIGPPLKNFLPELLKLSNITKLFLHAGETLWNGAITDENLIDAVMLNATRIGHAYAILKQPEVLKMVKERNVALEICPISNQVLGLVGDLRNHPANFLIANDYPVVITPDDPSFWEAKGLSYDWYVTFMAMASKHADLRLLKQLALNSIRFSSMDDAQKEKALDGWKKQWKEFLNMVLTNDEWDKS